MKKYFHIGVAVDTPNGLVVPVIRDVDQKSLFTLAAELAEVSKKAREIGLGMADMQGGCFYHFQFRWNWWHRVYAYH